jgi:hypothetical protein
MQYSLRWAGAWLALAAVLTLAPSVTAEERIPFQASGVHQAVSVWQVHGGVRAIVAFPDGESNLGDWEGLAETFHRGVSSNGAQMFEATLVMDFGGVHTLTVSLYGFWDGRLGEFGGLTPS